MKIEIKKKKEKEKYLESTVFNSDNKFLSLYQILHYSSNFSFV